MKILPFLTGILLVTSLCGQDFMRTELATLLNTPWEITYGPDHFLWVTEDGGKVARIHPITGEKSIIFTAQDYFPGSTEERSELCHQPKIGHGTLGLALHSDFMNPNNAYIYFVYSYNSGTDIEPATKFRIKRLLWNHEDLLVTEAENIVNNIPTGYDHLGGRLIVAPENGQPYLFLSIGDHGVSEDNAPSCYPNQEDNPNNMAQDLSTMNGKIHRYNMDGTIPFDNPIKNSSIYTRGHRNPQGLMYNPNLEIIYNVEHGDRTDDEINLLHKGMNYGWKGARGYHDDNYPGELAFVDNYKPDPRIENDQLIEPLFSWCTTSDLQPVSPSAQRCTVAPSGGIYYGSRSIPEWTNSLLIVTLKKGETVNREVYQFNLDKYGNLKDDTYSTFEPTKFFTEDEAINGRLRDIAVSLDGKTIYLINNKGADRDKITVYSYVESNSPVTEDNLFLFCPNPTTDAVYLPNIDLIQGFKSITVQNSQGQVVDQFNNPTSRIDIRNYADGIYFLSIYYQGTCKVIKFIKM